MTRNSEAQETGDTLSPVTPDWFIPQEELNLYDEVGLFQDETDWQDFVKERKARSLDYARSINLNLIASGPSAGDAVRHIFKNLSATTGKRYRSPTFQQMNCLLANLFHNHLQSSQLWTRLSRSHEPTILDHFNPSSINWQTIADLCDVMDKLGHIQIVLGHSGKDREACAGHMTRIRATDNLISILKNDHGWSNRILCHHPEAEVIVLKSPKTKSKRSYAITYQDTERTIKDRKLLETYNQFLTRQTILLPSMTMRGCPDLILTRRIFSNASWQEGGRLFGGNFQQLSETEREDITINGQPIVELDIKSCHATMAFAEAGHCWQASSNMDIYQHENLAEWPRELVKRAFNITLNAQSETKAKWALLDTSNKNGWQYIYDEVRVRGWQSRLLNDIQTTFPKLAHLFFCGRGMHYMWQEGEIGLKVIAACMAKDIPALTIFNSFIAPIQYEAEVRSIIHAAFQDVVGSHCVLK